MTSLSTETISNQGHSSKDEHLIWFSGVGESLYFKVNDGHFYQGKICADSLISKFLNPISHKPFNCRADPGSEHNHQVLSRESVEVATIYWACEIRVLQHHTEESIVKSIEKIVSNWPHTLVSISINNIKFLFTKKLEELRQETTKSEAHIRHTLIQHGGEQFTDFFNKVIIQPQPYWSDPSLISDQCELEKLYKLISADSKGYTENVHKTLTSTSTKAISRNSKKILDKMPVVLVKLKRFSQSLNLFANKYSKFLDYAWLKDGSRSYIKHLEENIARISCEAHDKKQGKAEIKNLIDLAKNHPLFKLSQLERWRSYIKAEFTVVQEIKEMADINGIPVISKDQLESNLSDFTLYDSVLVLCIAPLDELTKKVSREMKKCLQENFIAKDLVEIDKKDPWFVNAKLKTLVIEEIETMVSHIDKQGQDFRDEIQFSIMFANENLSANYFWYSIYKDGVLMNDNVSQLPGPPTGLRIRLPVMGPCVIVEWDYEDLGYPYIFVVHYRPKHGSKIWKKSKTEQTYTSISYTPGLSMEFRVAAKTCIGKSDFSDIFVIESSIEFEHPEDPSNMEAQKRTFSDEVDQSTSSALTTKRLKVVLQAPVDLKITSIEENMATLQWTPSSNDDKLSFFYRIQYWQEEQESLPFHQLDVASNNSYCCLKELRPETSYSVQIAVVSEDGQIITAPDSRVVRLKTLAKKTRFVESLLKLCKKIDHSSDGMEYFAVPLTESSSGRVKRFFINLNDQQNKSIHHKIILLLGSKDSGKSALIDGIINYIFGVDFEDKFRFEVFYNQADESSNVGDAVYVININHLKGFRIPFSLTIIDSPDIDLEYLQDQDAIQELDMIGIVIKACPSEISFLNSIFSKFGNNLKENFHFLVTSGGTDISIPDWLNFVTKTILPCPIDIETGTLHHDFQNVGYFHHPVKDSSIVMKNYQSFFATLTSKKTNSLSLTKQVLQERRELDNLLSQLNSLIKTGLTIMGEIVKNEKIDADCRSQIDTNSNSGNVWAYVHRVRNGCQNCSQNPSIKTEDEKLDIQNFCSTCSSWKSITSGFVKQRLRKCPPVAEKMKSKIDIEKLRKELEINKQQVLQQRGVAAQCLLRLKPISFNLNPLSTM